MSSSASSQHIAVQQLPTQGDPESKPPKYVTVNVTRYLEMVLDKPPKIHVFMTHVFMWITLAGFLVLPTTFPQLEITVSTVQFTRNIGVLGLGVTFCTVGGTGLLCLGLSNWNNSLWLLNNIFIPGTFNGFSGLIASLVNIYSSGHHHAPFGATSIATLAVTGGFTAICGSLALLCTFLKSSAWKTHKLANPREHEKKK
ncbi:hypothetical protein BGY98DRAFT_484964 [Russula aff. rugulosa BPL654]|nr:hypothetical protein BGY98DRAFT_928206 [Russula aff. rugulosa BPL654]KAI0278940.1 hypothetical protein BGY98DRAFT_484964 [Russula aff. rugulosa BPL654]